jgi:HK97 gp10 family phage protein
MTLKITLRGDKEIIQKIKELEKSADKELRKVVEKSSVHVERQAKRICPVDTGRLRSSITHEVKSQDNKHQGRIGTNVEYAPAVEFGTGKQKAQPYLFPALKTSRDFMIGLLAAAIKGLKK